MITRRDRFIEIGTNSWGILVLGNWPCWFWFDPADAVVLVVVVFVPLPDWLFAVAWGEVFASPNADKSVEAKLSAAEESQVAKKKHWLIRGTHQSYYSDHFAAHCCCCWCCCYYCLQLIQACYRERRSDQCWCSTMKRMSTVVPSLRLVNSPQHQQLSELKSRSWRKHFALLESDDSTSDEVFEGSSPA